MFNYFSDPVNFSADMENELQALSGILIEEKVQREQSNRSMSVVPSSNFGGQPMFAPKWTARDALEWNQVDRHFGPFD